MPRSALVVEPSEWEAMQQRLRDMGERLERMERSTAKPVGRLTPREAGKLFHVRHNVVRDACKSGELVTELTNKGWLIAPADAETWWSARMKREGRSNQ